MNICRVNADTNRHYDGIAKAKTTREPSARKVNFQLEILTEEKFSTITDDTQHCFVSCVEEWERFYELMNDKNIKNCTQEQRDAIAEGAATYFKALKEKFLDINEKLAKELAQEIIDNDCE